MNEIVGYKTISTGEKFPYFSGPCKGCGISPYGLSTSGPDYCGACAMGIKPDVTRLRRDLSILEWKYQSALFAIGTLTEHKPPVTDIARERAEEFLLRYKADEPAPLPPLDLLI